METDMEKIKLGTLYYRVLIINIYVKAATYIWNACTSLATKNTHCLLKYFLIPLWEVKMTPYWLLTLLQLPTLLYKSIQIIWLS